MNPQPEPLPNAAPDPKTQQEIINLALAEEKLRQELLDLHRPYLFRHPELLTALIASIGAIIGVSMLISDNYFKIRDERYALQDKLNNLQAERTAATKAEAEKTKEEAENTVNEVNKQIRSATDLLAATELAAKTEDLVAQGNAIAAQDAAIKAWRARNTTTTQKAIVDAYSLPVAEFAVSGNVFAMFSQDGKRVLTAGDDGPAEVWDAATGKQLAKMEGLFSTAMFSLDNQRIVMAGSDIPLYGSDRVAWIYSATGKQLAKMAGQWVDAAAFSPNGQRIVMAGRYNTPADNTSEVWDAATQRRLAKLEGLPSPVITTAVFSPDSQRIVTVLGSYHARTHRTIRREFGTPTRDSSWRSWKATRRGSPQRSFFQTGAAS